MKKNINLAGVTPETWARTIVLFIALINQILAIMGKGQIEIAESDIYQICSLVFTVISTIWAWWKNNSFSLSAQDGDKVMKALESGELEYTPKPEPETEHHHEVG